MSLSLFGIWYETNSSFQNVKFTEILEKLGKKSFKSIINLRTKFTEIYKNFECDCFPSQNE